MTFTSNNFIKNALFFAQAGRRRFGRASGNHADSFSKWFCMIVPVHIPDSTAWWRRQARELGAICDNTECGLMQSCFRRLHSPKSAGSLFRCECVACCIQSVSGWGGRPWYDSRSAEIFAVVRRGPLAKPTKIKQLEYLFTHVPKKDSLKDFKKHSLEHIVSFQMRVLNTERVFVHRGQRTPLGIIEDYCDRTKAYRDRHSDI